MYYVSIFCEQTLYGRASILFFVFQTVYIVVVVTPGVRVAEEVAA